jgi:hypothetical protein
MHLHVSHKLKIRKTHIQTTKQFHTTVHTQWILHPKKVIIVPRVKESIPISIQWLLLAQEPPISLSLLEFEERNNQKPCLTKFGHEWKRKLVNLSWHVCTYNTPLWEKKCKGTLGTRKLTIASDPKRANCSQLAVNSFSSNPLNCSSLLKKCYQWMNIYRWA